MSYQAYQRVGYGKAACARYPYPTPGISTRPYPVPGYFTAGVSNLPKCRVRVWESYQAYKVSGTVSKRGTYPWYTLVRTLPHTPSNSCLLTCPWERLTFVLLKGQHHKINNHFYANVPQEIMYFKKKNIKYQYYYLLRQPQLHKNNMFQF